MKNEDEFKFLQNNIKFYFNDESYYSKYSFDIWFTILAIVIVIYIVLYVYFSSRIGIEKVNWEKNKCNPFYMPFGAKINNGSDKFNENNLNNCFNGLMNNIAVDVVSPINSISNMFNELFKFLAALGSQIFSYITYLINRILDIFKYLIQILENLLGVSVGIFSRINNFIGNVLGVLTVIYYKLLLIIDSIKLILPMFGLSFLVGIIVPSILSFVITCIVLAVFYVIAVTLSPVFCIGCWAWAPVAVWSIVVIIMLAYTVTVTILYVIFSNMISAILERTAGVVNQ